MAADDRARYLELRGALFDRVTALPAFAALTDTLRGWLDGRRAIGIVHVEIAGLTVVESIYGWQVLDAIVARVAATLRASLGAELPEGTLLGVNAVAGDRFAAFVPGGPRGEAIDAAHLGRVCRRLRTRLETAFGGPEYAGLGPRLEFRTGHALLALDPFYRFERRVAAAIEAARSLPQRRHRRRERDEAAELERILRSGGVRTWFQPVVELGSGAVLGYEALARGPRNGPLETPRAMFAASERCGVSLDLDRACGAAALDAAAYLAAPGRLFLNVLPSSVARAPGPAPGWAASLRAATPARHSLVLEFPERAADADLELLVAAAESARAAGCGVALDDVGTAASGQAALERIRPDYVKLDLSLVRGIEDNLIKQEILRSVVRIASPMGASVIAEGIEARDEAEALAAAGARYGQGYLFARPAPRAGEPAS